MQIFLHRQAGPPNTAGDRKITEISVKFDAPVILTGEEQVALYELIEGVIRRQYNQFRGYAHSFQWNENDTGTLCWKSALRRRRVCSECGGDYGSPHRRYCTKSGKVEFDQSIEEPTE